MHKGIATIISLAVLVAVASSASAADYYVDVNRGNDANSGLSPDDAWKTLSHIINDLYGTEERPIVIHMAPGTYSPETGEDFSNIRLGSWVHLEGSGSEEVTMDAMGMRYAMQASEGCDISGITFRGGEWSGVSLGYATRVRIHDCVMTHNYCGIEIDMIFYCQAEIIDCVIEDNAGDGIYGWSTADHVSIIRCQIRNNGGCGCIISGAREGSPPPLVINTVFADNVEPGLVLLLDQAKSCVIRNCLFLNNATSYTYRWTYPAGAWVYQNTEERCSVAFQGCTFVGNSAPQEKIGLLISSEATAEQAGLVSVENCIFRNGGEEIRAWNNSTHGSSPDLVTVKSCCIEGGWEGLGEGNFDADPLFVTGSLGDYYLSHIAADQAKTSPCVDAGSESAYDAGLANVTTRTDGRPDIGVVDIGYHYPTLFLLPEVWVSTDRDTYRHGDTLEILFKAVNMNHYSYPVDLYAAVLTPDGGLWTVGSDWVWSDMIKPWFASLELPPNLHFGPATLLTLPIPSDSPPISAPGTYWAAAAFACTGTTAFISAPSISAFELVGN